MLHSTHVKLPSDQFIFLCHVLVRFLRYILLCCNYLFVIWRQWCVTEWREQEHNSSFVGPTHSTHNNVRRCRSKFRISYDRIQFLSITILCVSYKGASSLSHFSPSVHLTKARDSFGSRNDASHLRSSFVDLSLDSFVCFTCMQMLLSAINPLQNWIFLHSFPFYFSLESWAAAKMILFSSLLQMLPLRSFVRLREQSRSSSGSHFLCSE